MPRGILMITPIDVFILSFGFYTTGGIELLHQLAFELNKYPTINARISYFESKNRLQQPLQPPIYTQRYNTRYVTEKLNNPPVVIFPETLAFASNAKQFENSLKIIYWESVDNYYHDNLPKHLKDVFPIDCLHLTQSYYATDHVINKLHIPKTNVLSCTDYLSEEFFFTPSTTRERQNVVTYNPRKLAGKNNTPFIQKLFATLEKDKNIITFPLVNYSTGDLVKLLDNSKLYMDFGNHPGKDRIPREAAIRGSCVMTGLAGAARFSQDIFIPGKYKIEDKEENIPKIIDRIHYIFNNFSICTKDFDPYREKIKREKTLFELEVKDLVKTIVERGNSNGR